MAELSWIENDIQSILHEGGSFIKTGVSIEMLNAVKAYFLEKEWKMKVSYLNGKLYVKRTSHESGKLFCYCSMAVAPLNVGLSGHPEYPVLGQGSADVQLGGENSYQPDMQLIVEKRVYSCPNVVFEINYRGIAISELVQKGIDYIEHTSGVLSVILIDMQDVQAEPRTMSMVLCEIRRILPPLADDVSLSYTTAATNLSEGVLYEFRDLVSFGNAPASAANVDEWMDSTFHTAKFTGVGFNGPECNVWDLPDYQHIVPARILLAQDKLGLLLASVEGGPNKVQDYQLDLYAIQRLVVRSRRYNSQA